MALGGAALKAQLSRDGLNGPGRGLMQPHRLRCAAKSDAAGLLSGSLLFPEAGSSSAALLNILRMGAYQILYLDKIPDSAAVNESVELAKIMKRGKRPALSMLFSVRFPRTNRNCLLCRTGMR